MRVKHDRAKSPVRDSLIVTGIVILLALLPEVVLRVVFSQEYKTIYLNNLSVGLKDSTLGHVLRPNAHVIEKRPEFSVEYKINKEGLRDESIHPHPKPSNTTRILLIGDSFTFGSGNHYDEIWPVIFERKLLEAGHHVDVVKAGVGGYETQREVLYLERLFPIYNPDIVILTFLPNDLFGNVPINIDNAQKTRALLKEGIVPRSDKRSRLHCVTLAKRLLISSDSRYVSIYSKTKRSQFFTVPFNNRVKEQIKVTQDLLSRAYNFCETEGADFWVLSIPQQVQVLVKGNNYEYDDFDVDWIDNVFSDFAKDEGFIWIPTLDVLAKKYQSDKKPLYFRFDGHLNSGGNYVVGDYLTSQF